MTVGLILNNRDYGVALADAMVTIGDARKGDIANKLLHITAKDFYGAMVGAGDAANIFATFDSTRRKKPNAIERFMEEIRNFSLEYSLSIDRQAIESQKKVDDVMRKYEPNEDEGRRDGDDEDGEERDEPFGFRKGKRRVIGGIEEYLTSAFAAAVYDKKERRIKKYAINAAFAAEDPFFESVIGSGGDSAQLELMRLMSGAPLSKLYKCEIAFFGLCAYVRATQNVGVGGVPKIALIDSTGSTIVSRGDSIALANIVAAYHADVVDRAFAEQNVGLIIRGKGEYDAVAEKLSLSKSVLSDLLIPLDSWINSANAKRYAKESSSERRERLGRKQKEQCNCSNGGFERGCKGCGNCKGHKKKK